jgi:NAD(P)-dependent dehydrogenase (short-subunit alcohol dehydrogenase family)
MSNTLTGKVALVTGGTGGLGRAVTLAFLHQGTSVIATYLRENEAASLRAAVGANQRLELLPLNATDEAATQSLVDGITARHGHLDFVVNTIGAYAGGKSLWQSDSKSYHLMIDLNLNAGYAVAKAATSVMIRQKSGSIVNIAAKAAVDHAAGASAYAASKAAALALFDCLAQDLKGTGVRVNSILPSIIDTEANRKAMPGSDFAKWPKPEDIAKVILFLCGPDATVIHGANIPVYGQT